MSPDEVFKNQHIRTAMIPGSFPLEAPDTELPEVLGG